jgi:hypothetical protein
MAETQKIPWKRLAVEAVAIVGSILLAFAIDAWWQDREDGQTEQLLLKRLKADFVQVQQDIRFIEAEHIETSDACVALMNMPPGEPLPQTPDVDHMVAMIFLTSRTFNPGTGAVAAFLSSEGAKLVHNQPLVDLLLAWSGVVDELQEEDSYLQKGIAERWIPYLKSQVGIGPYLATYDGLNFQIPGQVSSPEMRKPLIVDQEFLNNVLDRYKSQQIALRDTKPVIAAVDQILELLDIEITE